MAWYRAGTVSVTNGSATVTGAGTDFVSNASIGEAFLGPDGRAYEIAQVVSATQMVLGMPYQGAGAGGQGYAVLPTQSFARDLARGAAELLNSFAAVREGVGQGLFPDGTVALPGLRFSADQDTGIFRSGDNSLGLTVGGVSALNVRAGAVSVPGNVEASGADFPLVALSRTGVGSWYMGGWQPGSNSWNLRINALPPFFTVTPEGSVLLGTSAATTYRLALRTANGGAQVWQASDGREMAALLNFDKGQQGWAGAGALLYLGRHGDTQRSANIGGTLNASGADYAEYMIKAAGCGLIAKGDVCGVDRNGKLTKTWAEAIGFVIKSTDPSLVGGDTWDANVGPKPEQPGAEPAEPAPPAPPAEDADDATIAAWRDAMAAYPAQVAAYQAARAEWQKATDAYAKALPVWEAAHEKARQCVDRIAFCGQVPANVSGDFEVGDYIIAAASGAGIKAVAVKADDMTLPQYMRRIGKVWAIRDGRAWIDVQHG